MDHDTYGPTAVPDPESADPLAELLPRGARDLLRQVVEASCRRFWTSTPITRSSTGAGPWCATARHQGVRRPRRRAAGARAELARAVNPPARPAGPDERAAAGDRRLRPRVLEGAGAGLPGHAPSALLDAQDRQCAEQATQAQPAEGEIRPAGDLDGRQPRLGPARLRHRLACQVPEGRGDAAKGPRRRPSVLRLPGRAPAVDPDHVSVTANAHSRPADRTRS